MNNFKYPNRMNKTPTVIKKPKLYSKANLGISFEAQINETNQFYLNKKIASIYKKPTPIQVVKVDYPSRSNTKIIEAYYKMPSTTDYNGIYNSLYIDFEAKSCKTNSFPFSHIYTHQIEHLRLVSNLGGIAFLIIEFAKYNEVYILEAEKLIQKYDNSLKGEKKSISYNEFKTEGYLVNTTHNLIDYLPIVDIIIKNKHHI